MTPKSISLTPELDQFLRDCVANGGYQSADEVVREALKMLQDARRSEHSKLDALRLELQRGIDSGPPQPFDLVQFLAEVRAEKEQANHEPTSRR